MGGGDERCEEMVRGREEVGVVRGREEVGVVRGRRWGW